MKDIKKALERVTGSKPSAPPPQREAIEPLSPDAYSSENASAAQGRQQAHGLSGLAPGPAAAVPPRGQHGSIPILDADISQFRNSAGGTTRKAQNVDGAFRALRTQMLDAIREKNMQVIGVTSPTAGAGKTVTAIHLALACARRADQNVILADFDYRRPAIAHYLKAENYRSTIDYFEGEGQITDYLTQTEGGNLRFLLSDESSDMSSEYLSSPRMVEALRTLTRDRNTIVIADLPPMIGCDDTLAIMPHLDGTILVFASGKHGYGTVERVAEDIPSGKLIAAVLNKVPQLDVKYDYSYTATRRR